MPQSAEDIKESQRVYYQKNKEKILLKRKAVRQTPEGKKKTKISRWKELGLLCDSYEEYEQIYERWLHSEKCEKKGCKYEEDNWKCMDHEHLKGKYGPFRNILCNRCNSNDKVTNTSGTPNVSYQEEPDGWLYRKAFKKKTHAKWFKKKEDAIAYKIYYESLNNNDASEPSSIT